MKLTPEEKDGAKVVGILFGLLIFWFILTGVILLISNNIADKPAHRPSEWPQRR